MKDEDSVLDLRILVFRTNPLYLDASKDVRLSSQFSLRRGCFCVQDVLYFLTFRVSRVWLSVAGRCTSDGLVVWQLFSLLQDIFILDRLE